MAKFIRVHDVQDNLPVIIQAEEIRYIHYDKNAKKAVIRLNGGVQCMVHETQDDLMKQLNS